MQIKLIVQSTGIGDAAYPGTNRYLVTFTATKTGQQFMIESDRIITSKDIVGSVDRRHVYWVAGRGSIDKSTVKVLRETGDVINHDRCFDKIRFAVLAKIENMLEGKSQ